MDCAEEYSVTEIKLQRAAQKGIEMSFRKKMDGQEYAVNTENARGSCILF